jgi:hypothetical protein
VEVPHTFGEPTTNESIRCSRALGQIVRLQVRGPEILGQTKSQSLRYIHLFESPQRLAQNSQAKYSLLAMIVTIKQVTLSMIVTIVAGFTLKHPELDPLGVVYL